MFIPKYWKHIAKTVDGIDMTIEYARYPRSYAPAW